jgi:ABC-2 type transport system ATP-binding protein
MRTRGETDPQAIDGASAESAAISVRGLSKRFGKIAAVDDLSFEVRPGVVTGFLGPNGAGKSTTLRMVLGLVAPTSGSATVLGRPYTSLPAPARSVGAVLETQSFNPLRTGRNHLRTLASAAGIPLRRADEVLEQVGLAGAARRTAGKYSLGMRQRLALGAALLGDPKVLILDEPANGLDPAGIREFRDRFRALGDAGVTVFISSHLLGEVERICDRVGIVDRGRLVAVGTVDELASRGSGLSSRRIRVTVRPEDHDEAVRLLDRFAVTPEGRGTLLITSAGGRDVNEALARGGVFADAIAPDGSGLEDTFLALTERTEGASVADATAEG